MSKERNNFSKLYRTIEEIRSKKYDKNITQDLLFNLLINEKEYYDYDNRELSSKIAQLFDDYFENIFHEKS